MRTVTREESEESRKRILKWAASGEIPKGGALGQWVYRSRQRVVPIQEEEELIIASLTPTALQRNWKTPSEFPMCPSDIKSDPLREYEESLEFGAVFSKNVLGVSITVIAESSDDGSRLSVLIHMRGNSVKGWAVSRVTLDEGRILHENVGSFFTLQGAVKEHCKIVGTPWDDSIDDYA